MWSIVIFALVVITGLAIVTACVAAHVTARSRGSNEERKSMPDPAKERATQVSSKAAYLERFHEASGGSALEEALKVAVQTRALELDLYWKRAAYFWTLLAAVFAAYFVVQSRLDIEDDLQVEALSVINVLGLTLSTGWYLVNRGSKVWQINWERHVELLSSECFGDLFLLNVDHRRYGATPLYGPYPFSVTKINILLSLYVVFIWLFLLLRLVAEVCGMWPMRSGFALLLLTGGTGAFLVALLLKGRTERPEVADKCGDEKFLLREPFL